jgi:hypothetical protein
LEGAGPAGQPSHISTVDVLALRHPLQWDGGDGGTMAKRRPTIPIAHADDGILALASLWPPTPHRRWKMSFTDEQWQAIEHAYGQQLNAEVRQQITTVTTQYLKDCVFERTAAPKAMARERIERIRRAAGDLEKVMLDSKHFSASTDELSREQQEQQQSVHSYADRLIRRHFNDPRLAAGWRGDRFRGVLTSLVVACDCALNDLSAPEGDGQPWDWWIQGLTRIAAEHRLPYYARIVSKKPSPFVALVRALQGVVALQEQERALARHTFSDEALAQAVRRARRRGDK